MIHVVKVSIYLLIIIAISSCYMTVKWKKKLICIWDILAPKFCAFAFLKSALRKLHLPISNFHFMESLNFASSQPPLPTQLNTKINIIWGEGMGEGANVSMMLILLWIVSAPLLFSVVFSSTCKHKPTYLDAVRCCFMAAYMCVGRTSGQ